MFLPLTFTQYVPRPRLEIAGVPESFRALCKIVGRIFLAMAMITQYADILASLTIRHWYWFSSTLQAEKLILFTRNIASLALLKKCFTTVLHPIPKNSFAHIGRQQGLRITHDIIYRPASGICLGMSLAFLSKYLLANEKDNKAILVAAQFIKQDRTETSVKLQALYDALTGIKGSVQAQEIILFRKVLEGGDIPYQATQKQDLLDSLKVFLIVKERPETLRQFVLIDLENKDIEITPDIYALTLELDAFWHLRQHPDEQKNDCIHNAIIQTMANYLDLESTNAKRLHGEIAFVGDQLSQLADGGYLIQFSNHTIALVKTQNHMALMDSNEGMALHSDEDQKDALLHLLRYYASNGLVALKVISLLPKIER